jgi:phosphoenolpyruvate carboxylase
MSDQYSALRKNVRKLGDILGDTLAEAEGADLLSQVEKIRLLSKAARNGDINSHKQLLAELNKLSGDRLVAVVRSFNQFLNLANIADQHHTISREAVAEFSATNTLTDLFSLLDNKNIDSNTITNAIAELKIELVLTAHPTEITRRTLINKYGEIDDCLGKLELTGMTEREQITLENRLRELITQIWHSNEFRQTRPSPVDEAKWGFAVVENSLWQAVPDFLRRLDNTLFEATGKALSIDAAPVKFVSWMGGDRDGNPNVTAVITEQVLMLSRWKAADLYLPEVMALIEELSIKECSGDLQNQAGDTFEPYRTILKPLRNLLNNTIETLNAKLIGSGRTHDIILSQESQLWDPLFLCWQSLHECGMARIADGRLLDLLRRVKCFGVHLVRLDIRQESDRHTEVFSELTQHLDLGDYAKWDEQQRSEFLLSELNSKRPLFPNSWQPSPKVQEVLKTCAIVAEQPATAMGGYIISMARQASDILAVQLLMKEAGAEFRLPIGPLFETLDDLNRAEEVMESLLSNDWYRSKLNGHQMVMIGYSDSAKDAGVFAASWAQYLAQEKLLNVCDKHDIKLTLFHGRGGTIGRGGAPAHQALLSQPPGSLRGGLRVTEQGEMIRAKLGLPAIAIKSLALYASAIVQANLLEPPMPKPNWRKAMDKLAQQSCEQYRAILRGESDFVEYFRQATPVQELADLPLGSRPAKRKATGGIETLRAIPWIFAWSQNRLLVPAWLGAGAALEQFIKAGNEPMIHEMRNSWPFFKTRLSMLEMVYAKADLQLAEYYDQLLVDENLRYLGEKLRTQLKNDTTTILHIGGDHELMEDQPWIKESIHLRNIYTDPLNLLQAELLKRNRIESDATTKLALMTTIAGIAAGMRNTG